MLRILTTYYLPLALILFVLGGDKAFGWPWSTDMWEQPSIKPHEKPIGYPQKSISRERSADTVLKSREEFEEMNQSPVRPTRSSLERGEKLYNQVCFVCHGMQGKGNGTLIRQDFYPIDLTSAGTKGRTDGYIYAYIRYGGKVMMPSYRENITHDDAWHIVNYVRKLQGKLNTKAESR